MDFLSALPLEIMSNITDQLHHHDKLALRQVSRYFSNIIPPCITLKTLLRIDTLHITARFRDGPIVHDFLTSHDHSVRSSKKMNAETGMVDCFRTFKFPPTSHFPMFAFAKIDHFLMNKFLPVTMNNANIMHLTNLLSGCTFNHIRLVFDHNTASNVQKIPYIVADLNVKHVEFVLIGCHGTKLNRRLADQLVSVGVKEVSFSDDDRTQTYVSRSHILDFFGAGVEIITVSHRIREVCKSTHDDLIRELSEMKKPLRLKFYCTCKNEDESFPKYNKGVNVRVHDKKHNKEMYGKLITIQFDGMASKYV